MKLRDLRLGLRLGLGFGLTLLGAALLLVTAILAQSRSSSELTRIETHIADVKQDMVDMQIALLQGAIAIRNMGMESAAENVNKARDVATAERKRYLSLQSALRNAAESDEEKTLIDKLVGNDQEMDRYFNEAVGYAAVFSTDQSTAIISGKIDPLLEQGKKLIAQLMVMKANDASRATAVAERRMRTTVQAVVGAGIVVLLLSGVLAWRMTISVTQPLHAALAASESVAQGNLCVAIEAHGRDEAAQLLRGLILMRDNLVGMVDEVRARTDAIAGASGEIAQGSSDLSGRTETQAGSLQQAASTMEQLGVTVAHNAANASQASELALGASAVAGKGGQIVGQVVTNMQGINQSSKKIAEITAVIDGIAFQTNILALNAAVEAARAGEQGRGFAVVASEVRSLAGRSAAAAKEIKTLIADSVERVENGAALVDQAGRTMTEIVEAIQRVTAVVSEISDASAEQSQSVSLVVRAVSDMDEATQRNSALAEESTAAAVELRQQTGKLVQAVAAFTVPG